MISFRICITCMALFLPGLVCSQEEDTLSVNPDTGLFQVDTSYFENGDPGFNLLLAAEKGDILAIEILLRKGINPDSRTSDGVTPLMYAAEQGNSEAAFLLLDHGADPNLAPDYGPGALISAAKNGFSDVSAILLDYGARVNEKDEYGLTALMYASAYDFDELVHLYSRYGADPLVKDAFGSDALIIASFHGSYESAKILLENKVDVDTSDFFGFTPLIVATQKGHYDLVWLLLENGADISLKNQSGLNALAMAVAKADYDIAELLIENGADVNSPVRLGNNPLDIAREKNDDEIVGLLKSNGARTNLLPYFKSFSMGICMDFNQNDFMTGMCAGLHESKYGFDVRGQVIFRPARIRTIVEESDNIAFQFWERRWMATGGITKRFDFKAGSGHTFGPYIGLDVNYTWGSYRGADRKPHPSTFLSPAGGFSWRIKNFGLDVKYSYKDLDIPGLSPHRLGIGCVFYTSIIREKLTFKEISWF